MSIEASFDILQYRKPAQITQAPPMRLLKVLIQIWDTGVHLKWKLGSCQFAPVCYILLRKSLAGPADSRVDSRLRHCKGGITFTEFTFDSRVARNFLTKGQLV